MTDPQILIVEDNPIPTPSIKKMFDTLSYSNVTITKSIQEALLLMIKSKPDIILLDVELSEIMDTFFFTKRIKEKDIAIILIAPNTNSSKVVYEKVKEVQPFAYLIKPINSISLESIIASTINWLEVNNTSLTRRKKTNTLDGIFIKVANKLVKLNISDILAVEAEGNYCTFYTLEKKLVIKQSLTKVRQKLPNQSFFQIHRNYIIQSSKVTSVSLTTNEVIMGTYRFPIGGKYRSDFFAQLTRF